MLLKHVLERSNVLGNTSTLDEEGEESGNSERQNLSVHLVGCLCCDTRKLSITDVDQITTETRGAILKSFIQLDHI
jgi:hypothetical protein